jgi:glycosyltransferase involved in cell wall biosynthesis
MPDNLNVTWVTRTFLDYRVPVFAALNELIGGRLSLLYSADSVPERVRQKISAVLGRRAVGLTGEWGLGPKADDIGFANSSVSIAYQPGVLRRIWRTRPDVLVGDGFFKWTIPALITRVIRRVPLVLCYERTHRTERNCQWYRTVYRRAVLRFVDAMCCNGQETAVYVRSLGMDTTRITLKNMAADVKGLVAATTLLDASNRTAIRRNYGIEGVCFLYSGRLVPRKGVLELLDAWRRHESTHPTPGTLVLVGEGPEEATLRSLVAAHNLQRVRFVGSVDYNIMHRYYQAADVFVIATLEDNWSLVVPEAMACALPILSSQYNGCCPELVHPGRNGYIFDPTQPASLAALFSTCCARSSELSSMGRESQRILSDYTPEAAAKEILRACLMARGRRSTEGVTCQ